MIGFSDRLRQAVLRESRPLSKLLTSTNQQEDQGDGFGPEFHNKRSPES